MKYFWIFALIALFLFSSSDYAAAQDAGKPSAAFMEQLAQLNRMAPLQNPRYERARDILNRKILDSGNKTIGEVQDVVLDRSGNVESLLARFDRLHLRQDVYVNYQQMAVHGMTDGYRLAFQAARVEEMYPELLAGIETASGEDSDTVNLKALQGMALRDAQGQKIGEIKDVLFSPDGRFVQGLYVEVDSGTARGAGVAIPFDAVTFLEKSRWTGALLGEQDAQALLEFSRRL